MPTPLDIITGYRFAFGVQHAARVAICQHVRGRGARGPRWRRGSNARKPNPYEEAWTGEYEPCHHCGAEGGDIASWKHYECCTACGREWPIGDYDWWKLGDVLRFRADEAAGLIETFPDSLIVHGFDVMTDEGRLAFDAECRRRRDEREAGTIQPWQVPRPERIAQLRAEREGYVAGRAGRPLAEGADEHYRAGHEHGFALYRRSEGVGMGVFHRG